MKTTSLLSILVLSLALSACGQDKPAETAPAGEAVAPPMPMPPDQGVAGADAPATAVEAVAGVDAAALYAARCASCHGAAGEGVGQNPKIAGLTQADMASRLKDYRDGKQMGSQTAVMAAMAKPLSDEQIEALAAHLGE